MESQDNKGNFKAPGNEEYDINRPQNLAKPAFNSASGNRDASDVPPIENLNHEDDENDQLKANTAGESDEQGRINDERLQGNDQKPDLGNSDDLDDKEDEKLIRK